MPRYDFKCPQCGVTFEMVCSTDVNKLSCVECSKQSETLVMAERQLCFPAQIHIH